VPCRQCGADSENARAALYLSKGSEGGRHARRLRPATRLATLSLWRGSTVRALLVLSNFCLGYGSRRELTIDLKLGLGQDRLRASEWLPDSVIDGSVTLSVATLASCF
jgi:hypothetical protein